MSGLRRELGFTDAASLVAGSIFGAGIFIAPNLVARQVTDPFWIIAAWVIGGFLSLCGALAFAELGAMLPASGGMYVYIREAWGERAAFLYGWAGLFVLYSGAVAWISMSFSAYLGEFFELTSLQARLAAAGLIVFLALLNCGGIRLGARVLDALTVLKVLGILLLVAAAFLQPARPVHGGNSFSWAGLGLALVGCLLAYDGWVTAGFVAGEMRNPARDLPRAIFAGVTLVIALYAVANVAYLRLMTPAEMASAERVGALAAERGIGAGRLFAGFVMLSVAGPLLGFLMAPPRIFHAMASDGLFPRVFARVSERTGAPWPAILGLAAWSIVLVLTGTYEGLATGTMMATWLFYGLAVLGVLVLRHRSPAAARPFRLPQAPLAVTLFCGSALAFIVNALISTPLQSLPAAGLVLTGLPAYAYWRSKRRNLDG